MNKATATLTVLMGSLLWMGCGDESSPTGPGANAGVSDTGSKKVDINVPKADTTKKIDSLVIAKPDTTKKVDTAAKPDTTKAPVYVNGLIGTWVADTTLQVGMFQVGVTSTVVFSLDGSFLSSMTASVLNNPISGDLYTGKGAWAFSGPDTLIATSTTCTASDTAKATAGMLSGMSLPFAQVGASFVANPHKPTTCPAPMVLDPHPASTSIRIVQTLDIPTQGKQDLPLRFVLKP